MNRKQLRKIVIANLKHAYFNAMTDDVAIKNGLIPGRNHVLTVLEFKADDIMDAVDKYIASLV